MENKVENGKISPSQYFDYIKNAKNSITLDKLKESYVNFIVLAEKYNKLGQVESMKKLAFLADTLVKEEKLIKLGVTTFVYKDVIEDYIINVADKSVKIIELSRYTREVPDEFIDVIEKTRPIFDEFYVVFTDYTGSEERKVEKERRDKDPILFGVFKNRSTVCDRFYFLGDWVDEYCDLTLDKMIESYKSKKGYSPANDIIIPETSEELVDLLKDYTMKEPEKDDARFESLGDVGVEPFSAKYVPQGNKNKGFFERIRTIFKK